MEDVVDKKFASYFLEYFLSLNTKSLIMGFSHNFGNKKKKIKGTQIIFNFKLYLIYIIFVLQYFS